MYFQIPYQVSINVTTLKNYDIVVKVEAGFTLDALKSEIIKIVGEEQKFRLRCGKTYLTIPAHQQQLNLLAGRTHNTLKVHKAAAAVT